MERRVMSIPSGPLQFAQKWTIGLAAIGLPIAYLLYFFVGPFFPREAGPNTRILVPPGGACRSIFVAALSPTTSGADCSLIRIQLQDCPRARLLQMNVRRPEGTYWLADIDQGQRTSGSMPLTKQAMLNWICEAGMPLQAEELGDALYHIVSGLNEDTTMTVARACEGLARFKVQRVYSGGLPAKWVLPSICALWTFTWLAGLVWGSRKALTMPRNDHGLLDT